MGLMIPHSYTVDIANGTKKEKITNALIYGDADSHEVTVTVLSGGIAAVMTGYSGILYAVRMADRVTIPNEATIVGNVVTAKLAQGCLLARGRVDLLLTLTKDGDSVSPLWVEATCAGGITDTIADPAEIIPTLSDLLAQISALGAATDDANTAAGAANAAAAGVAAAIAPAYSPSSTYALGAVCTYLGTRYKCTTAITVAEAWTAGHWTAEDVQTVLDDHGSQLADIGNEIYYQVPLTTDMFEIGSFVNGVPSENLGRIRSKDYMFAVAGTVVKNLDTTGFKIGVQMYTQGHVYISAFNFATFGASQTIPSDCLIKLVAAYRNDRTITTEMFPEVIAAIEVIASKTAQIPALADGTGLNDGAVKMAKRTNIGEFGLMYSATDYAAWDYAAKTVTWKCPVRLAYRNNFYIVDDGSHDVVVDLSTAPTATYGILLYNWSTKQFVLRNFTTMASATEYEILIAAYSLSGRKVYMPSRTRNGNAETATLISRKYPDFDFAKMKLTFYTPTRLIYDNTLYSIDSGVDKVVDITIAAGYTLGVVYYNVSTGVFTVRTYDAIASAGPYEVMLACFYTYDGTAGFTVSAGFQYTVNGRPPIENQPIGKVVLTPCNVIKHTLDITGWSDFCFVGNELWVFGESTDDSLTINGTVHRYNPTTYAGMGTMTHNFGHCNTVDYCAATDTLIMGNGSGSTTLAPHIFIFPGASAWAVGSALDRASIGIDIDLTAVLNGTKCNVCWGESNGGRYDICYVMQNNNKNIYRLQLGKGSNDLGSGTLISGKSDDQFNGTYRVIASFVQYTDSTEVNNGSCYGNGCLYIAIGHSGAWVQKNVLTAGGSVKKEYIREIFYGPTGATLSVYSEGIKIHGGKIFHGVNGDVCGIMEYDLV